MADRAISELTPVTDVNAEDSFVLQQNNRAMRLTGQVLLNWLAAALDGHGGINNIAKTSTSGLVDTYTITFADESTATFTVTNGKAIASIAKTGTVGLVDTYTITYNDSDTDTFTVTNGNGITSIAKTGTQDLVDTYTITMQNGTQYTFTVTNGEKGDQGDNTYTFIMYSTNSPTQDSDIHSTPDNWMGIYYGTSSTAPTSYQAYQWFEIKGEKGDTGDSVVVSSTAVDYSVGDDGTTVPQNWQSTVPTVPQGKYLWTRTVVTYTYGTQTTSTTTYTTCRNGIDGSGSVNSVNNISPDANHNITLPMDNVPTANSGNFVKSGGVALIDSRHENCMAYPYDPTSTYEVGEFCIHENSFMRCIQAIEMGEAWDATHWEVAVIGEIINGIFAEVDDLQNELSSVESGMAIIVDGNKTSYASGASIGQYVLLKNSIISGCSDGAYVAAKAIPYDTVIDDTYLTAVSGGIANELNSKLTRIGEIITATYPTTSVPSNAFTTIASLSLTAGTWVISGGYEYESAFTARAVTRLTTAGPTLLNGTYIDGRADNGGGYNVSCIYSTNSARTINMQAWQGSSATKTVTHTKLQAVRIA